MNSVKVLAGQRLTTSPEPTSAPNEVTSWVEPEEKRCRAATQVKVVSPEIAKVKIGRSFP